VALAGHSPELQALEASYFGCLGFAALPTLVAAAANSFFAGRGDSRTVLLVNGTGLAVNGVLAYAFIFGRWGFTAGVAVLLCTVPEVLAGAFRVEGGAASWGDVMRHLSVLLRFVAVYSLFDCLTYVLSAPATRGS
jgi:Na+-driven multidrug efflux pump